jgi:SAM-dependent methyltransferase
VGGYGEDLAAIHAAGFTALACAAAAELLPRLAPRSRIVELGCGDGTTARLLGDAGHAVHAIDSSPALVELARRNAPGATVAVGSFGDAEIPTPCDAVIAIGEVLGYRSADTGTLDAIIARVRAALRPGGLLMFDLAGPGRERSRPRRGWTEGDGWAVLIEAAADEDELQRRIVTFRVAGNGRFRRSEELHRLRLHAPSEVLRTLRAAGFSARTLPRGYDGTPLPRGLTAYLARRR